MTIRLPYGYLREFKHTKMCEGCDEYGTTSHSHTNVTIFPSMWIQDYWDYQWARQMRIDYLNEMNSHKKTKLWKERVVGVVIDKKSDNNKK